MRKIIDWLEHRTGLETAIRSFLYEDIPASSGWHQIIGSTAVFFFVIQVFTGGLLGYSGNIRPEFHSPSTLLASVRTANRAILSPNPRVT